MRHLSYLPITLLCLLTSTLTAQNLELGFWGGFSSYSGDLSPSERFNFDFQLELLNPAGGIFVRTNPTDLLSVSLGVNLLRISGEDGVTNENANRMLNFRSRVTELALRADLNLFRLGAPTRTQVVPFLSVGGSVFRFNPETNYDGNWIELQPLRTEAQGAPGYDDPYSLTSYALVIGGGIKFIIKESVTIGLELVPRRTFTDYLDDVTSREIDYIDVLQNSGTLAAELSNPTIKDPEVEDTIYERGGEFTDWLVTGGITVGFTFGGNRISGKGIGCPTF